MITRAIVEEVINPHQVKVRIPIFDASEQSSLHTNSKALNIATVCTLPNFLLNIQVGDVLFVGFEDNTSYKTVVLGYLSRSNQTATLSDIHVNSLIADGVCQLSSNTSIGDVLPLEIKTLKGAKDSLQNQIDLLKEDLQNQIDLLKEKLDKLLE